jgi:hypothetical protein
VSVAIHVAGRAWPLGSGDFVHAFFSTVTYHLEPGGWGSRFPALMNGLYAGELEAGRAQEALRELDEIRAGLRRHAPVEVVWDIEDPTKRPPWGDDISGDITDLGNYFVTDDGRDLLDVLAEALHDGARANAPTTVG